MEMSLQVIVIDFYMSRTTVNGFVNGDPKLPIIRVFGPNADGVNSCAHIHGVLPYFYVSSSNVVFSESSLLSCWISQFCAQITQSLRNGKSWKSKNCEISPNNVEIVSSLPLYGYHEKESLFLKIHFYDPEHLNILSSLIHDTVFVSGGESLCLQCYESHIPFLLQFMLDYSVFGMGPIHFENVSSYRKLAESTQNADIAIHWPNNATARPRNIETLTHTSSSASVEFDALASQVSIIFVCFHPAKIGNKRIPMSQTCEVPSLGEMWNEERRRCGKYGINFDEKVPPQTISPDSNDYCLAVPSQAASWKKSIELMIERGNDCRLHEGDTINYHNDHVDQDDKPNEALDDDDENDYNPFGYSKNYDKDSDDDFNPKEDDEVILESNSQQFMDDKRSESKDEALPLSRSPQTTNILLSPRIKRLASGNQLTGSQTMTNYMLRHSPVSSSSSFVNTSLTQDIIPSFLISYSVGHGCLSICPTERKAPSASICLSTLGSYGITEAINQDVYFSNPVDKPAHSTNFHGLLFHVSDQNSGLIEFQSLSANPRVMLTSTLHSRDIRPSFDPPSLTVRVLQYLLVYQRVIKWAQAVKSTTPGNGVQFSPCHSSSYHSEITGPTQTQAAGTVAQMENSVKYLKQRVCLKLSGSPSKANPDAPLSLFSMSGEKMTMLIVEVHCSTRGQLLADPRSTVDEDDDAFHAMEPEIAHFVNNSGCIVVREGLCVADDIQTRICVFCKLVASLCLCGMSQLSLAEAMMGTKPSTSLEAQHVTKMMATLQPHGIGDCCMHFVKSEYCLFSLFQVLIKIVDPDIIGGYDIRRNSIGYLVERGNHLSEPVDVIRIASRVYGEDRDSRNISDEHGKSHSSGIWIKGRIILNVWRIMRSELKLPIYSFHRVVHHVIGVRYPEISNSQLCSWLAESTTIHRAVRHICKKCQLQQDLLSKMDVVRRVTEMSKFLGIDFFSSLTRGSQYRVEAVMMRIAKKLKYIAISPSRKQVARQAAMEGLPLILEPESSFYKDPVIVLDFVSLYPSMMIGYNLCFSTCLGRLKDSSEGKTAEKIGVTPYSQRLTESNLASIAARSTGVCDVNIAPNGTLFCKQNIRKGVIPKMLEEILATRVMIKSVMKAYSSCKSISASRLKVVLSFLDARQTGLKMIANVTYGYTAAGFSGRMPMAELADAVVFSGRSTLEKCIHMVEDAHHLCARVVYGDTDSMFVLVEGRKLATAFDIAKEIIKLASFQTPSNVLLKLEKVFFPCILQTKKRYVGLAFQSFEDLLPVFDAKGIECVRRDQCGLTVKLQERCLRILFNTRDASQVKKYLQSQWAKILAVKVPLQDYVFSKEVRLSKYVGGSSLPPSAVVSTKMMMNDPMAVPEHGERVPYIVIYGPPESRLMDLVIHPLELFHQHSDKKLNATYYITKQILPALDRVLSLTGLNVAAWYEETPRPKFHRDIGRLFSSKAMSSRNTITQYFPSTSCLICGKERNAFKKVELCNECLSDLPSAVGLLQCQTYSLSVAENRCNEICCDCVGSNPTVQPGEAQELESYICRSLECPLTVMRMQLTEKKTMLDSLLQMLSNL